MSSRRWIGREVDPGEGAQLDNGVPADSWLGGVCVSGVVAHGANLGPRGSTA